MLGSNRSDTWYVICSPLASHPKLTTSRSVPAKRVMRRSRLPSALISQMSPSRMNARSSGVAVAADVAVEVGRAVAAEGEAVCVGSPAPSPQAARRARSGTSRSIT